MNPEQSSMHTDKILVLGKANKKVGNRRSGTFWEPFQLLQNNVANLNVQ